MTAAAPSKGTQLQYTTTQEQSAQQALCEFAKTESSAKGVVLISTPKSYRLAVLSPDGQPWNPDDKPVDLSGAFEVRAFTAAAELRWRGTPGKPGVAVMVREGEASGAAVTTVPFDKSWPAQYLAWGSVVERKSSPGNALWVKTYDGQVGELWLPVASATDGTDPPVAKQSGAERVVLESREYVGDPDQQGVMTVIEERLVALRVGPETELSGSSAWPVDG